MFRYDVSEFSLFGLGKSSVPRPSYQPAVEALEERVVLNVDMTTHTPADDAALVIISAQDRIAGKIQKLGSQLYANIPLAVTLLRKETKLYKTFIDQIGAKNVDPYLGDYLIKIHRTVKKMLAKSVFGRPIDKEVHQLQQLKDLVGGHFPRP